MYPQITLTGADEKTNIAELANLRAEIGFLYSSKLAGTDWYKYPSLKWIKAATKCIRNTSLHICGNFAREELIKGYLNDIIHNVDRIQVNGDLTVSYLEMVCEDNPTKIIITQHKESNKDLVNCLIPNHVVLIDSSGGKGILPDKWVRPPTNKKVGFAGGLGPDNLEVELPKIRSLMKENDWIDMESNIRANNFFSLEKCKIVLEIFHRAK